MNSPLKNPLVRRMLTTKVIDDWIAVDPGKRTRKMEQAYEECIAICQSILKDGWTVPHRRDVEEFLRRYE